VGYRQCAKGHAQGNESRGFTCPCVYVAGQGWWLLVGRELRMVWEGEEGVEPWRVGDWPPGPPTPQSPIPTLVLRGPVGVSDNTPTAGAHTNAAHGGQRKLTSLCPQKGNEGD
jgi:hypothetical protein